MASPFNPDLGNAPQVGAVPTKTQTKDPNRVAAEAAGSMLDVLGEYKKEQQEAEAAAESSAALTDFQTDLINLENRAIRARNHEADVVGSLADAQQGAMTGDTDQETAAKIQNIRNKNQQLENANRQGALSESALQIRKNNLLKQALNDPQLAGFQSEVNKIFKMRDEFSQDPMDGVFNADDRARLGPNPTPARQASLLAEKRMLGNLEFQREMGTASFNRIQTNITPTVFAETKKVRDMAAEVYEQQGAITSQQQDELNTMLTNTQDIVVQNINQAITNAVNNGRRITAEQQERLINNAKEKVQNVREWINNKDLHKKLKQMNDTEDEVMRAMMPGGLGSISGIGKAGGSSDLFTAMNILRMDDTELESLAGDNADMVEGLQEQSIKLQERMLNGVRTPGFERLETWIAGAATNNGTNAEMSNTALGIFSELNDKDNLESALNHLNKQGVRNNFRKHGETISSQFEVLARNYASTLSRREYPRAKIVRDGNKVTFQGDENTITSGAISQDRNIIREFNKMLENYNGIINREQILSIFPEFDEEFEGGTKTMRELEQQQRNR